jgi:hypothetical protein
VADLLNLVFYSFWTFIGTVILLSLAGKLFIAAWLGTLSLIRGVPVRLSSAENKPSTDAIVRAVRDAMAAGKLDAEIGRINQRNETRRNR